MPKIKEVIEAIECVAPLHLQESYDNSGLQVGDVGAEASGALLCVDATADVIDEAIARGCNLVITHHPLLFHGVKCVAGRNRPEVVLAKAIQSGICIYSSHTALDAAVGGISRLTDVKVLVPSRPGAQEGLGAVGNLPQPMEPMRFLQFVKAVFGSVALRYSLPVPDVAISRVALCGGAAGEFVPEAIAAGAQVYLTADCKHNQMLDHADRILLVDAGHYETEQCATQIFLEILTEKFPNFAVAKSQACHNPVACL